jgi:hypothetical protein
MTGPKMAPAESDRMVAPGRARPGLDDVDPHEGCHHQQRMISIECLQQLTVGLETLKGQIAAQIKVKEQGHNGQAGQNQDDFFTLHTPLRAEMDSKGMRNRRQTPSSSCVAVFAQSDHHVEMSVPGLCMVGAQQAIPPGLAEAEITVRLSRDNRVMDPVHVRCNQKQAQPAFHWQGNG